MGGGISQYLQGLGLALAGKGIAGTGGAGGGTGNPLQAVSAGIGGQQSMPTDTSSAAVSPTADIMNPMGLPPLPKPTFFDNPAVQGALATYLGAIGTPRYEGLGVALSRGGLQGLQAYQQARSTQLNPYLAQAQLAALQQRVRKEGAETQKVTTEEEQLLNIPKENQANGQQMVQWAQQHPDDPRAYTIASTGQALMKSDQKFDLDKMANLPADLAQKMQATRTSAAQEQEAIFKGPTGAMGQADLEQKAAATSHEQAATLHENVETQISAAKSQTDLARIDSEYTKNLTEIYFKNHPWESRLGGGSAGLQDFLQKERASAGLGGGTSGGAQVPLRGHAAQAATSVDRNGKQIQWVD